MFSKSKQYNLNKQSEQKITYLESMLKESDSRVKDYENQLMVKEKDLVEALNRMREYESGDYQLQQAVNEIKALKNQIKIRDRDIETLTRHLNKLDMALNDVFEENEDFRAKLNMKPREKINIEELNHLRAIRAQEARTVTYVLQKEVEDLQEENSKLHLKVRKLAKQIRSKEVVATILEEEASGADLSFYNDLIESKGGRRQTTADNHKQKTTEVATTLDAEKKTRDAEQLRKRIEQLMQQFDAENQQLEKSLREIYEQLTTIRNADGGNALNKSMQKAAAKTNSRESAIKAEALEKLLSVSRIHLIIISSHLSRFINLLPVQV